MVYSDSLSLIYDILSEDSFKNSLHLGSQSMTTHQIYSFKQTIIMQSIYWTYPEDYQSLKELFNACIQDNRISQHYTLDIQTVYDTVKSTGKPW